MKTIDQISRAALGFALLCSLAICGCDGSWRPTDATSDPPASGAKEKSSLDLKLKKANVDRAKLESQILEKERKFAELRDQFRETLNQFGENERQKIEMEFKTGRLSDKSRGNAEIVRLFGVWKKVVAAEKARKEARNLYDRLNAAIASLESRRVADANDVEAFAETIDELEAIAGSSPEDALTPEDVQLEDDVQNSEIFAPNADETAASNDVQRVDPNEDVDAEVAEGLDVWKFSKFSKTGVPVAPVDVPDDAPEPKFDDDSAAPAPEPPTVVPVDDEADSAFLVDLNETTAKLSRSGAVWFEILILLENADRIESIPLRRERSVGLDETLTDLEKRLKRQAESDPSGTETIRKRFQALVDPKSAAQEKAQDEDRATAEQKKNRARIVVKYYPYFVVVVLVVAGAFAGVLFRRRRPVARPIPNVSTPGNPSPIPSATNPPAQPLNLAVKWAVGIGALAFGTALGGPIFGLVLLFCLGLGFGFVRGRDAFAVSAGCLGVCLWLALSVVIAVVGAFFFWHYLN